MHSFSADWVYPISSAPIKNGVLLTEDDGTIIKVLEAHEFDDEIDGHFTGILCPGFVNVHCHLELSHMKGAIPEKTGLVQFIKGIITKRHENIETLNKELELLKKEWLEEGTVACGDISNTTDANVFKKNVPPDDIRFYTFVEAFDLMQSALTKKTLQDSQAVLAAFDEQDGQHKKSIVPHAPYSVSPALFEGIATANAGDDQKTISIHNQETPAENEFLDKGTGEMADFFGGFGAPLDAFAPTGQRAIYYAMKHMDPKQRTLFIHNTTTNESDLQAALAWSPNTYWGTCANANLYIENKLPDYDIFVRAGARVCIGTDSIASNWQLSIVEEMKTILKHNPQLNLETVLRWATLNGAQALGFDDTLGSFETGKKPGVVLLDTEHLDVSTNAFRII